MARMLNISLVILLISSPFLSATARASDVLIGRNLSSLNTPLQTSMKKDRSLQINIAPRVILPNTSVISFENQSYAKVSFCVRADEKEAQFNFSVMADYSDVEKYSASFSGRASPRSLVNACIKSDNVQVMVVRDMHENEKISQYANRYTFLVAPE